MSCLAGVDEIKGKVSDWSKGTNKRDAVKNLGDDEFAVKAEYRRTHSPSKTLNVWNKSGAGTTITSGPGTKTISLLACHQRRAQKDKCGKWVA
ncbi:hypothetical protein BZB76_1660 [Actinomadura pelletieri DSM 43383]|uniref:Uncharacterized protein n=1 Tax=Actinomadura pelletieri DSM 43383 TaxID=1120940 RepID=A0A495QS81_9ACTN|nr:hypothetical protein [Actinomadura pelletieri]RKS76308.1 hypothetical protein BZB76_1660 [Actinomadura pelletieri DSM 43383]